MLHVFYGGAREPYAEVGPLTEEQITALAVAVPTPGAAPTLDDLDRRILRLLRVDGRAPVEDVARSCGTSASTVRRRLTDLRAGGVLYLDVDVSPTVHEQPMRTMLHLTVLPQHLDEVGRALAAHPEVPFAAATTGRTNVYASVASAGPTAFYRYLTTAVAGLPGVTAVESEPVIRTVKAADTVYAAR